MSATENGQTSYHRMSVAEKQAYSRANVREQAVACPRCDTQTTAADLLEHLEKRCAGPRDPGPGSKWVTWREALELGVPGTTLTTWTRTGLVRSTGSRQERRYLQRDAVVLIAARRARQPR